ncbi:MAG: hypothetical protein H0U49_07565 [Parachlamydiaceae bacterium]|nr:hypothetical protein [Parachlamydiaceae bacterium]
MQIEGCEQNNPQISFGDDVNKQIFWSISNKSTDTAHDLNKLRLTSIYFKQLIDNNENVLYAPLTYGKALLCKVACREYLEKNKIFKELKNEEAEIELNIAHSKLLREKAVLVFHTIFCNELVTQDRIKKTEHTFNEVTQLIFKQKKKSIGEFNDLQIGSSKSQGTFVSGKFIYKAHDSESPILFIMSPNFYREYYPNKEKTCDFLNFADKQKLLIDLFNRGESIINNNYKYTWPEFDKWKAKYSPPVIKIEIKTEPNDTWYDCTM